MSHCGDSSRGSPSSPGHHWCGIIPYHIHCLSYNALYNVSYHIILYNMYNVFSSGMSTGAIVVIAAGGVLLLLVIIGVAAFLIIRQNRRRQAQQHHRIEEESGTSSRHVQEHAQSDRPERPEQRLVSHSKPPSYTTEDPEHTYDNPLSDAGVSTHFDWSITLSLDSAPTRGQGCNKSHVDVIF